MSNVDIPGKYIFRVDSTSIEQGGCNVNGMKIISENIRFYIIKKIKEKKNTSEYNS